MSIFLPLVAFSSPLDAVLEEVGSQLRALLLVIVHIGAVLVGVPLRGVFELGVRGFGSGLARQGRIQVAIVGCLAAAARGSRTSSAARRGPSRAIAASLSAAEVLVGEFVRKAGVWVVAGAGSAQAALGKVGVM